MAIYFDRDYPQDKLIKEAVSFIQKGGIVIYPTDTVYGMGCDILAHEAVKKIFRIKQIKEFKPLSFLCRDISQAAQYARISQSAYKIMKRVFPGPYTIILKTTKQVPKILLTRQKTVGIRIPSHPLTHSLLSSLERPLINTSASTGTGTYLSDPGQINEKFGHLVDIIIDRGLMLLEYSSIIDLTDDHPLIYRKGKGDLSCLSEEAL